MSDAGDATNADGTVARVVQIEMLYCSGRPGQDQADQDEPPLAARKQSLGVLRKSGPRKSRTS